MKVIKRIIGSVLIMGVIVVFTGCTEKEKTVDNTEATGEESTKGIVLPEGYPKEFVPIMEDAISAEGVGSDENYSIYYTTPSTAEDIMTFYEKCFEKYGDSAVIAENKKEINLEAEGKKVNIVIDTVEKNTSVKIKISKITTEEESDSINDEKNDTVDEKSGTDEISNDSDDSYTEMIDFPTDIVPIMAGGDIVDQNNKKTDDTTEYSITLIVSRSYVDTVAYYNSLASEDSSAVINNGDVDYLAKYTKENNSIEILISNSGETETTVTLNVTPSK
jgi:hypothetical protein